VFKWEAITAFIEGTDARVGRSEKENVEEAKAELRRLLDRGSQGTPTASVPHFLALSTGHSGLD